MSSPWFYELAGVFKMRLSSKARVALTAMIDIALREGVGPVPLTDIAARQQISLSYLEQLFSKLRLQGLVTSTRGPHGGYLLGHRTEDITVTDIILAVDDGLPKAKHSGAAPEQAITQYLWDTMNAKMLEFTRSMTLKSLVVDLPAIEVRIEPIPLPRHDVFRIPVQPSSRPNAPQLVSALGGSCQTLVLKL
jgi:Rrf2 family iron-sulfur cluster assembly transcriptional regulator